MSTPDEHSPPQDLRALSQRIGSVLTVCDGPRAAAVMADLTDERLAPLLANPSVNGLLVATVAASPYLARLIKSDPARLERLLSASPEASHARADDTLTASMLTATAMADAMSRLRVYKTEIALLVALADLAGVWPVMRVTQALTQAADLAIGEAVRFLLRRAVAAGDLAHAGEGSGYIVIGMGKYGAHELNYSSDVDLIIFYDRDRVRLREGLEPGPVFVRMTRDLVRLMQERTAEGYVFRIDLRLRPDPGATQVALSTVAALHYYESYGQNWERAALIKARACAGDIEAGQGLLAELAPYIWRKYLDYASIADIHAMKRQIHAFKGFGEIGVAGHNIKVGRGGIREIEFFVQTQQLIAGGRQTDLRSPGTLLTLDRLVERKWISAATASELQRCYRFLRMVEHRIQMIEDEQTQTLPREADKLLAIACLSGFPNIEAFSERLRQELTAVQRHYSQLFETKPELTRGKGNLVFAGDEPDPATVETLRAMGYTDPASALSTVKDWHFGRYQAMRSAIARERLTELQPVLLEVLGTTPDPNATLASFDRFLAELPAGVQLFSLLHTNPGLLRLLADILGSAPRLAHILSRRTRVLDAVLDPGFFGSEPTAEELTLRIRQELAAASDYPDKLDRARLIGNEQAFLIGVRVLTGTISAERAGGAYARLAEAMIGELQAEVDAEMVRQHGRIDGGSAAVIAMGKLGGREMAANSDLDLIVVYDFPDATIPSDGPKPLPGQQYYGRFTQRLIASLAAQTAEGRLYDVDMRLRPSGAKGPVASHLIGFADYQQNTAWTWEHMALTRARVLTGPLGLRGRLEGTISSVLTKPRDTARLANDVKDMRERIATDKGSGGLWDLKLVRGGLLDIEFITQYLQLKYAPAYPGLLDQNTLAALANLSTQGLLSAADAAVLVPAAGLYQALSQILRLCLDGPFDPAKAPKGLAQLMCRAGDAPDLPRLEVTLRDCQTEVAALFGRIIA